MACNSTKELNAVLQKHICSWQRAAQPWGCPGTDLAGPTCASDPHVVVTSQLEETRSAWIYLTMGNLCPKHQGTGHFSVTPHTGPCRAGTCSGPTETSAPRSSPHDSRSEHGHAPASPEAPPELTLLPVSKPGSCCLLQLSSLILCRNERRHLKLSPR